MSTPPATNSTALLGAAAAGGAVPSAGGAVKSKFNELRKWIVAGPMALKVLAFGANVLTIVACFVTFWGTALSLQIFQTGVIAYVGVFAFVGMMLEVKPCICSRRVQGKVSIWCKILSRVSGRGFAYIIMGLVQCAQNSFITWISGLSMIGVGVLSLIVAWAAKKKLYKMHTALVAGHEQDYSAVVAAFREHDSNGNGSLDIAELAAVAKSLGSEFSKNELVAVFALLDTDGSGDISEKEFQSWWFGEKQVDYSLI